MEPREFISHSDNSHILSQPGASGGFVLSGLMTEAELCRLSGPELLLFLHPVYDSLSIICSPPQRGQQSLLSCYCRELLKRAS